MKINHQFVSLKIFDIFVEKVIANTPKLFRRKKIDRKQRQLWKYSGSSNYKIKFPPLRNLITDSSKMRYLEKLLAKIKAKQERVLIFC